ncbi:MAG: hypothetical protein ND895_17765 [Pyrinomonadaceae bacterium]|nr:hypothetical protein [Pyrinomonadaceae bacterium]
MSRLSYKLICLLLTLVGGIAVTQLKRSLFSVNTSSMAADTEGAVKANPPPSTVDPERPADFFIAENPWMHDGYTIEKNSRKAPRDDGDGPTATPARADVHYVVVKKAGKVLGRFDANVYFGLGNSADFALFPFLGGKTQQLFISQDVPRGGCQWIVSLSPRYRIIFDGSKYGVGREGYDLATKDLDGDGVYEVIAPITDFYDLQDKMSISAIPLPDIIFKFDPRKKMYRPANSLFRDYVFQQLVTVPKVADSKAQDFQHRSAVISNLLIHVYADDEKTGWNLYDRTYSLDDKKEMRRRIKALLRNQPVYKFIYNHRGRKS